ncbi:MAG: SMP-30/gluconolactonase/LRE family protein [Planctomycetota bacterium]|nr:SMP-30/gluconolactonase/LRE family protein [Planctomycetota bacterium]
MALRGALLLTVGSLWLAGCGKEVAVGPLPDQEVASFDTPESVLYDEAQDLYLVSNISGSPTGKDNNGYIAKMRPDGTVDSAWIRGGSNGVTLHAPKGMAVDDRWLYVADIDVVRKFDRVSGAPAGAVAIEGASFLNDLSVAPDGELWITDTGLNPDFTPSGTAAVYVLGVDGEVRKVASGPELGLPNGIVARDKGAYVVTWDPGSWLQVDKKGRITELLRTEHGKLDGLVRLPSGKWLCSSWDGRCLYEFNVQGGVSVVPSLEVDQPADIGFDHRRGRVLIPLFGGDRVALRQH